MAVRITVKHQLTLSEWEECWLKGFVADTARDSSSEGKHRSELDLRVFSNSVRNRFQSTTCSAEEHTQLQGRIARTIRKESKAQVRYRVEMVPTAIDPEKPVSDGRYGDPAKRERPLR